ncbi:hypothetical protein GCM10009127_15680 [Alteraurantiacibacter aestuarii]|uniref:Uncharacterized protein n=1 Tax=Alteraurantiacibacter aestuarii TaxID=650004 RepID=A0A844ZL48_9SPHN|nr:hypothetical protein [Alteraurantiacibacter aestuarii]MXO87846.1 hypothetical protein [Alteraurantiacibacter aestuarii]
MLKIAAMAAAALASAGLSSPLQAQEGALSPVQQEFYAELLAMGDVCSELPQFRVHKDDLQGWVTQNLASSSEDTLDTVLDLRAAKIEAMQADTLAVREMPPGASRTRAVSEHYADVVGRCLRMAQHDEAGRFFQRN